MITCRYEEVIQFAALQCQIQLSSHNPAIHKPGFIKYERGLIFSCINVQCRNKAEYLPPSAQKNKNAEKDIINEYRKLVGMSEVNAKYRYVQLCRSLKTYGITFFKTKVPYYL
jgi:talin